MRVSRRRGRVRLLLEPAEVDLLISLCDDLARLLTSDDIADPALARLTPAAYPDDEAAQAEYRSLTAVSLHQDRTQRIQACRADLANGGQIELTAADAAQRWIQVLNDLRLALGTRLGITEDDNAAVLDPADPATQPRLVYQWLTAVQDAVVQRLLR